MYSRERTNEILDNLKEYLQSFIDSGEHKIFYNDLMCDEKTIDCINAIDELQERINKAIDYIENSQVIVGKDTTGELYQYEMDIIDILKGE